MQFKDKLTVLVVDDSPESLSMINMALDDAGIAVLVALNGQQAINVLEHVTPDIVLLDAVMPVMDGFQCAREVRKKLPLTPIIFMTGLSEVEHIVKAFDAGANDYIVKPIRPEEMLVRIRQHSNNTRKLLEAQKTLDAMRQHVFCINKSGRLIWATPEAQVLLNQYSEQQGQADINIEERLSRWLSSGAQDGHDLVLPLQNSLMLTVYYFKQTEEDEYLLKIQSPDVAVDPSVLEESLKITYREAEVLLWLAHGKTNREIAEILKMSPRTVNKHLEQMYPKIGANNRTTAASIAIQKILGGRIGMPGK
ncbi:DNA-binding response regulator [sulfur-oxidizing endosymbiont of Gigantopelta aegis]|uniref:response regulator transcription factor n=1 Tax=sulfur-oxidizing endosymbiont of Gigantopelta aegis TaxID=2794934 RepID=UPI0018DD408A|nr:DNA-binding response regulator [sulfur-oxidizing endosymbiont of Gigantopelta aegis]